MHPMILGICILAAYVGMAVWFEREIRRAQEEEPMNLQAPHHIFITIDHDRRSLRVFDDERQTSVPWDGDAEPVGVETWPGQVPVVTWRVKAGVR